jgi:hypothetical protein
MCIGLDGLHRPRGCRRCNRQQPYPLLHREHVLDVVPDEEKRSDGDEESIPDEEDEVHVDEQKSHRHDGEHVPAVGNNPIFDEEDEEDDAEPPVLALSLPPVGNNPILDEEDEEDDAEPPVLSRIEVIEIRESDSDEYHPPTPPVAAMYVNIYGITSDIDWEAIPTVDKLYHHLRQGLHTTDQIVLTQGGQFLLHGDRINPFAGDIEGMPQNAQYAVQYGGHLRDGLDLEQIFPFRVRPRQE